MHAHRTNKAPTRATARSQISNRSRLLLNVDGRSSYARRFRDLVGAFSAEIGGGSLTEFEQGLVKQAAILVLKTEQLQECVVRGQEVDADTLIRLSGESRRILSSLRTKAGARESSEPVAELQAYLAASRSEGGTP
jgi:hypothetical protein